MTFENRTGMNDANFAALMRAAQEAAKEDRDNLRAHIDDCIEERREAKRDRHKLANDITALGGELHGRINRMERRGMALWLTVGGTAILLLLSVVGGMGLVFLKGIFLTPIGGQ
jgi:cytochrome P450